MNNDERFEQFIKKVSQRPLPPSPMARIRTLAKEFAEGASERVWGTNISLFRGGVNDENVFKYLQQRWNDDFPHLDLLISNGYLVTDINAVVVTKNAFDLLSEVEPASVFISYRREDSSAFALLVLARFKAEGLDAFLDLAIEPGQNWRDHLKQQIQNRDYLVLLLGKNTLNSVIVRQEAEWALESGATILPIWHSSFRYKSGEFDISPELDAVLQNTHTIRVIEESAVAYNNAIIELLNRFGVTP